MVARYGYKQSPNVSQLLQQCRTDNLDFTVPETTFFLGRVALDVTNRPNLSKWRKLPFGWMLTTADDPSSHFRISPEQVVEIGIRLPL